MSVMWFYGWLCYIGLRLDLLWFLVFVYLVSIWFCLTSDLIGLLFGIGCLGCIRFSLLFVGINHTVLH